MIFYEIRHHSNVTVPKSTVIETHRIFTDVFVLQTQIKKSNRHYLACKWEWDMYSPYSAKSGLVNNMYLYLPHEDVLLNTKLRPN